jgi:CcmD family protein
MAVSGGILWVMAVNLIIWTGLFVYLWRLDRKLAELEDLLGPAARQERKS